MATTIHGNEARKNLELVAPLNNVIQRRIADFSLDILEQVISHMTTSPLNILHQLDDTNGISNGSQLITLVRLVHEGTIKEIILFSEELKTTAKTKDVFQFVKEFFARHKLDTQSIGSVCTDGALAVLENKCKFFELMKQETQHLQGTHRFRHYHALG